MPPPPSEDNTDYSNKVASFKGREYIAIDHERMELAETTLEVWVYPTSVRGTSIERTGRSRFSILYFIQK